MRRIDAVREEACRRFPAATWTATSSAGDGATLARAAARGGADLVVAVGGDGTINEVVNGLMDAEVSCDARPALGILPAGTGSDFVRTLRVPHGLRAALEVITAGRAARIDLGEIVCAPLDGGSPGRTRRYFVNMAGCGSTARVAERFNRRKVRGTLGYAVATALTALDYRFPQVELAVDGHAAESINLNLLFICNGEYCGGGMRVGKGVLLDDGMFQVVEVAGVGRLGSLLQWPRLYTGSVGMVRGARVRAAREIHLASKEDVLVDCDGEVCGRLPATYRVVAGALNVCVP